MNQMNRMKRIYRKWATAGRTDPRYTAPAARMTVVTQTPSKDCLQNASQSTHNVRVMFSLAPVWVCGLTCQAVAADA